MMVEKKSNESQPVPFRLVALVSLGFARIYESQLVSTSAVVVFFLRIPKGHSLKLTAFTLLENRQKDHKMKQASSNH